MERVTSFYELLEKNAHQFPDKTAILYDTFAVSYAKLFEDVKKKAIHLSRFEGKRIALYGPSSYRWIVNMFGIILAGKDAILVDFFLPKEVKAKVLHKIGTDYILSSTNQYILADEDGSMIPHAEKDDVDASDYTPKEQEGNILMFTATAGESDKCVVLTTAQILNTVRAIRQHCGCDKEDMVLSQISLHHVFGYIYSMIWPLSCGACVCVGRGIRHIDADTYYYNVTTLIATPSMVEYLKRVKAFNKELKKVVIGGAPCSTRLFDCLKERDLKVYAIYGMTECTGCIAISKETAASYELFDETKVTIGDNGELLVSGACVMVGYDHDDKTNAQVLKDGVFHTSDYGYFDDNGKLVVTRRNPGILLLPTGEKICRSVINEEIMELNGIAESYLTVYEDRLTVVIVPIKKDKPQDSFKRLIDKYNERKGYRWEIQCVVVAENGLPKLEDGSVNDEAIMIMLKDHAFEE